jgi:hypothetical protein
MQTTDTVTVEISFEIAMKLSHTLAPSHPALGDSFDGSQSTARRSWVDCRSLTAAKGQRIANSIVPGNMDGPMKASEHRAWSFSPLAGVLWEHGLRASRAIAWARCEKWKHYTTLTVEPYLGNCGWRIISNTGDVLGTAVPADKGSLHRLMSDSGFTPTATPDVWQLKK